MREIDHRSRELVGLLWIAGSLGIIATAVAAVLPALLVVWQLQLGVSVSQSGFVAATELAGQVIGTLLFVWANRRWSSRSIALIGLSVMIIGNLASAASLSLQFLVATRIVAGSGGGLVRALAMMCLSKAISPGRAFSLYAAAQVALAATATLLLPRLILLFGPRSPFVVVSGIAVLGVALSFKLPRSLASVVPRNRLRYPAVRSAAFLSLCGLFLYFLGQGAVWTYLGPIGDREAIPAVDISYALALLNIAGIFGALGIGALAHHCDARLVIAWLQTLGLAAIVGVFHSSSSTVFIASCCIFYFSWCASFPFQFSLVAHADGKGNASSLVSAIDGTALASGAALAGVLMPHFSLAATGWIYAIASTCGVVCYVRAVRGRTGTSAEQYASRKGATIEQGPTCP